MSVSYIAATPTEASAVRRAIPGARVVVTGMGLRDYREQHFESAIVCGVAGGLRAGVPTGTVVIASHVLRTDGTSVTTDDELTQALANGARALGFEPLVEPLLASATLVTGSDRERWSRTGCVAVDMESGGISARRFAVVRVVLDTPERELSPQWLHPARAMLQPNLWPQLVWLARNAPACARRAATVAAAAGVS